MKHLLLAMVLFLSTTVQAKERREYEQIDAQTVKVLVYQNDILQQEGQYKFHEGEWQTCGIWKQYDETGAVNMRVMYECGKRLWVERDFGDKLVYVKHKERAF